MISKDNMDEKDNDKDRKGDSNDNMDKDNKIDIGKNDKEQDMVYRGCKNDK